MQKSIKYTGYVVLGVMALLFLAGCKKDKSGKLSYWSPGANDKVICLSPSGITPAPEDTIQYLVCLDITGTKVLYPCPSEVGDLELAPGGSAIAFTSTHYVPYKPQYMRYLEVLQVSGGSVHSHKTILYRTVPYSGAGKFYPVWSPDGSHFLVKLMDSICSINADGSGFQFICQGNDPQWSPGGNRIAFFYGDYIYLVNADGTGLRTVTSGTHPVWTPAGDGLIYAPSLQTSNTDEHFYRFNLADSSSSVIMTMPTNWREIVGWWAWSPDRTTLCWVITNANNQSYSDLFMQRTNGTAPLRLASVENMGFPLRWSPDSRQIMFSGSIQEEWGYVINADGSGIYAIKGSGYFALFDWN